MDLTRLLDAVMPEGTDRLTETEMLKRISFVIEGPSVKFRDNAACEGMLHGLLYYAGTVKRDGADIVRRDPSEIPGAMHTGSTGTKVEYQDEHGAWCKCLLNEWPTVREQVRLARLASANEQAKADRQALLRRDLEEIAADTVG